MGELQIRRGSNWQVESPRICRYDEAFEHS
jgi:hypothetical protein